VQGGIAREPAVADDVDALNTGCAELASFCIQEKMSSWATRKSASFRCAGSARDTGLVLANSPAAAT
jgi:hypothetical protein